MRQLRPFLLALPLIVLPVLHGQEKPAVPQPGFGMFFTGNYSAFYNSAKSWDTYYKESNKRLDAAFGIGFGEVFLNARYGVLKATGKSKVTNLPVTGVAVWDQEFFEAGLKQLRLGPGGGWYFDMSYVRTRARESISTLNPEVDELASNTTVKDEGVTLGVGLLGRLIPPVYLDLSVHITATGLFNRDANAENIPSLGGWTLSIGICVLEQ